MLVLHFISIDLFTSSIYQLELPGEEASSRAEVRAERSSSKMARPVHGLFLPLLLAVVCLLLFQVSECSRPSSPSPADHLDDALHHHQLLLLDAEARTARPEVVGVDGGRTGGADADAYAAAPSASTATPALARAMPAVVASSRPRQTSHRPLVRAGLRPAVLLRSKLARRFLAGAAVDEAASATDGAAASCRSNNPHINCGSSASKP